MHKYYGHSYYTTEPNDIDCKVKEPEEIGIEAIFKELNI